MDNFGINYFARAVASYDSHKAVRLWLAERGLMVRQDGMAWFVHDERSNKNQEKEFFVTEAQATVHALNLALQKAKNP